MNVFFLNNNNNNVYKKNGQLRGKNELGWFYKIQERRKTN